MNNNINIELPVEHVSDTAWLVAEMRALESERADAVFKDPLARKLVGTKGPELLKRFEGIWDSNYLLTVRTTIIDGMIHRLLNQGIDTVINLAAGLDTRPYRLRLPSALAWVEVDFPALINYKNSVLANDKPICNLERVAVDLADDHQRTKLLRELNGRSRNALVITEGLLGYLTEENVVALTRDLRGQSAIHWWIMDVMDRSRIEMMHKELAQKVTSAHKTPLRFAPKEGADYFRPFGWAQDDFQTFLEEGLRINRLPTSDSAHSEESFMKNSGIALLKRS